jgi:nicotinamidase-related amidase
VPELPIPPHFRRRQVGEIWRVPYQERADQAQAWAEEHGLRPALADSFRICLVAVDVQNTFCIPGYELYVRGAEGGKYDLTIWPYHAMLGGIGHALVPAVEEAIFFHTIARYSQPAFQVKGDNPLTEHYSVLGPEITQGPGGETIAGKNDLLIQQLSLYDVIIVGGQAKSHCVAWTIADLLEGDDERERALAPRTYLLEDCTSPVVVPGMDYTAEANAAFERFAAAGMHVVRSTEPIESWPGIPALVS